MLETSYLEQKSIVEVVKKKVRLGGNG